MVGREETIRKAAELLGNSVKALNETHFVPLFAGIVVGTALGTLPRSPRLPQPLRLGLAGALDRRHPREPPGPDRSSGVAHAPEHQFGLPGVRDRALFRECRLDGRSPVLRHGLQYEGTGMVGGRALRDGDTDRPSGSLPWWCGR